MKIERTLIPLVLGIGMTLALLWVFTGTAPPAVHATASHNPAPNSSPGAGNVLTVCLASAGTCPYTTIQAAVDIAGEGDVIKVAAGIYQVVHQRAGITQVVYISKTIAIEGGYTTTNWTTPNPLTQPTTLDARGQGRVLYIIGDISPRIEGLHITGGNAQDLGGHADQWGGVRDAGGGVCIIAASATVSDNQIFDNTTGDAVLSSGGGLYLRSSAATIAGNTVTSNTARRDGGGLYLYQSDATLLNNVFAANGAFYGGGLRLDASAASVSNNTIISNTARYSGGGIELDHSDATINGNTITLNAAGSRGGGACLSIGNPTLHGNTVNSNTADYGGGLHLDGCYETRLTGNMIRGNTAYQEGGGICLWHVYLADITLANNFVVDNYTTGSGSGLYVKRSYPHMLHNTIARNSGGDGSGLYITNDWNEFSNVSLENNILVSHTVGITVAAGNVARVEGTLWGDGVWRNGVDWGGVGDITTGTVNIWESPDFVDPEDGDYHIGAASAAVDAALPSDLKFDADGDPRPAAFGFDIGADERSGPSLHLHKAVDPPVVNPGETLTYTITITNVGTESTTNTLLKDTLPALQRALAVTASQGHCMASGAWGGEVACDLGTLSLGDRLHITLTAQVMSTPPPALPQVMHNTAWVTASETANVAHASVLLQNCHVRLNDSSIAYRTVQAAVDAAGHPADVVKIAGICGGVNGRGGLRQHVYLSRTLSLQGGWDVSFTERNVDAHPTTLDALGRGRVLYITGDVSPTIEGLRLTGGDAAGLSGGGWIGNDVGGGVYVISATVTMSDCQVLNSTARAGGGLYLSYSAATLSKNTIAANTASVAGGGLYIVRSDGISLVENDISSNRVTGWAGGGLVLGYSDATLRANSVTSNTAGSGGGLLLNTYTYSATLEGNLFSANMARSYGGGIEISEGTSANLVGNVIISNSAEYGGGLYVTEISNPTLINTVVADNHARTAGAGICVLGSSPRMLHTTLARNSGGQGSAIYVDNRWSYHSSVMLTNTLIVSHAVGISVTTGNTLTVNGILWHHTPITISRTPTAAVTVLNQHEGDPRLAADGYHLLAGSAAIDRGVDAGITHDIDGEPRPTGAGHDIGADEFLAGLQVIKQAFADPVEAGTRLTYMIWVTNTSRVPLAAVVTDTLPAHVSPTGVLTWMLTAIAPGAAWTEQFSVTVNTGYTGPLTNVVEAYTGAGARATYTETSTVVPSNQAPYTPANPTPADNAVNVPLTQTLSWQGGDPDGDPVTYTVAFGTSDPPPFATTTTQTSFTPTLAPNTTYYWAITASDGSSATDGPTWQFATGGSRHVYLPLVLRSAPGGP